MRTFIDPENITQPYYFTDEDGNIEGAMHHIKSVLKAFEPIDVLNGKTKIYDSEGRVMILETDDISVTENNEYPNDYSDIKCAFVEVNRELILHKIISAGHVEFID